MTTTPEDRLAARVQALIDLSRVTDDLIREMTKNLEGLHGITLALVATQSLHSEIVREVMAVNARFAEQAGWTHCPECGRCHHCHQTVEHPEGG